MMRRLLLPTIWLLAVWVAMYRLGRTWGSTAAERHRALPGDDLVPKPMMGGDHAVTIDAPAADVWPWLIQMGWHRGGWYTYRWVDALFFPQNIASAGRVRPDLQTLSVGDHIPDGPPDLGCFFVVEELQPGQSMVLQSTTHLPPQLLHREGVAMRWTWTFVIEPEGPDRTRFHFRWRALIRPFWLRAICQTLIMPADFVMGRSMCLGLKRRVEPSIAGRGTRTSRAAGV